MSDAEGKHSGPGAISAEQLAAADWPEIVSAFRNTAPMPVVTETMRLIFEARDHKKIWQISAVFSGFEPDLTADELRRVVGLRYYYSRMMLEIGAAERAYQAFSLLVKQPELLGGLEAKDISRIPKFYIRACMRSGRFETALQACEKLIDEKPRDWEAHYLAGLLAGSSNPDRRSKSFGKVLELAPQLPASVKLTIAGAMIDDAESGKALAMAISALRDPAGDRQFNLSLANIRLKRGDAGAWAASVRSFFEAYDIAPPLLQIPSTTEGLPVLVSPLPRRDPAGPSIAVIMTTYNAADTVAFAIASVLSQTYPNFQLVVVDDASEDATVEIVGGIAAKDARVRLIVCNQNLGTYSAKNRGLSETVADFYTFHDSDDWMHPERLTRHVDCMAANPQLICSSSAWFRMDAGGRSVLRGDKGFLYENPTSMLIRRKAIEEVGYFDAVRVGADSEFSWRIRRRFGEKAYERMQMPLAVGLHRRTSLTQSGKAAYDGDDFSSVRLDYWESWTEWHRKVLLGLEPSNFFIAFPSSERPFSAPSAILT